MDANAISARGAQNDMKRQLTLGQTLTALILSVVVLQAIVTMALFLTVFNPGMQARAFDVIERGAAATAEAFVNRWRFDMQIAASSVDDQQALREQLAAAMRSRSEMEGVAVFLVREEAATKKRGALRRPDDIIGDAARSDFVAILPKELGRMQASEQAVYTQLIDLFMSVPLAQMGQWKKDGMLGTANIIQGDLVLAGVPVLLEERLLGYLVYAESVKEYQDYQSRFALSMVITFVVSLIVVAILVFFIGTSAARPMTRITQTAARIADGDLTHFGQLESGLTEMFVLSKSIQDLGRAFHEQVTTVQSLTATVSGVSLETVKVMANLSVSASEQAAAVAETAATVEEMEKTGKSVSLAAGRIVEAAEKSSEGSARGRSAVDTASEIMVRIKADSQNIFQKSKGLLSSVEEIGNIINSVNAIAEQSKILAVNASIEAAKAGEYGVGFAVVAQEVKELAGQSKEATEQITHTLTTIRQAIEGMVETAENGEARTLEGVTAVSNAGAIVNDLSEAIMEASAVANEINSSVNQQSLGLSQIASAVEQINISAMENQSISQRIEDSTRQMANAISELQMLVDIWITTPANEAEDARVAPSSLASLGEDAPRNDKA